MKIFLDTANIDEIEKANSYGVLDGVTTNPSLIKKAAKIHKIKDFEMYIKKILKICKGKPVSLEVIGDNYSDMVREGKVLFNKFNGAFKNVYVKIPVNPCMKKKCTKNMDGIRAIRTLSKLGIPINCTLVFSPEQALLAANAGAKIVSPFLGREDDYIREVNRIKFEKKDYFPKDGFRKNKKLLEDEGIVSGVDLIAKTALIFRQNNIKTNILAASIRNKKQLRESVLAGADIVTIPFGLMEELMVHEKTVQGMKSFLKDTIPEYKVIFKR